jgi:hypothetical protein
MSGANEQYREMVILLAFDDAAQIVERAKIGYDDYYADSSPLIDDGAYRASRRIVKVTGTIYNSAGDVQSSFENWYGRDGKYARSRTVHHDGTITED